MHRRIALKKERQILDRLKADMDKVENLATDPIMFPHRYTENHDREVVALLSAFFAYGNVKAMQAFLDRLFTFLAPSPYESILAFSRKKIDLPETLYYRFQSRNDIETILYTLGRLLSGSKNRSLELYFADPSDALDLRIDRFRETFLSMAGKNKSRGLIHWTGKPGTGGARKKVALFLRWMVRKGWPDFGIYRSFSQEELVIPVDTHIMRLAQSAGWTMRKSADWKTALEITEAFRSIRKDDPLAYDFALTRPGITGICRDPMLCKKCPLHPVCMS